MTGCSQSPYPYVTLGHFLGWASVSPSVKWSRQNLVPFWNSGSDKREDVQTNTGSGVVAGQAGNPQRGLPRTPSCFLVPGEQKLRNLALGGEKWSG